MRLLTDAHMQEIREVARSKAHPGPTMADMTRAQRIDAYMIRLARGFHAATSDVEPAVWSRLMPDLPDSAPMGWSYPIFYPDGEVVLAYSSPVMDDLTADLDEATFMRYLRAVRFICERFVELYRNEPDLAASDQLVDVVEDDLMVTDADLYALYGHMKERSGL